MVAERMWSRPIAWSPSSDDVHEPLVSARSGFLFGVAVEAGDRAKSPGDRRSGSASRFEFPSKRFDVRLSNFEQPKVKLGDPRCVDARVERVGLTGWDPSSRPRTRSTRDVRNR